VLGVSQEAGVRYHDRGDRAQPLYDFSCVVEPTHMGVAGGEIAMRLRVARILLDRKEQFRHCLIELPAEEMRGAYHTERRADPGAGTEAQRGFAMLDRDVQLARAPSEEAAVMPAARDTPGRELINNDPNTAKVYRNELIDMKYLDEYLIETNLYTPDSIDV
jgi:hypothetical protein